MKIIGNFDFLIDQLLLQLEPAHSGHAYVENGNGDRGRIVLRQKLFRAGKSDHSIAAGLEQPLHRIAYSVVVIDDVHDTHRFRAFAHSLVHSTSSLASLDANGSVKVKIAPPSGLRSTFSRP